MPTYAYQGKTIRPGRGWTDSDGIQHPGNWNLWSEDEIAAKGITVIPDPPSFDSRFYFAAGAPRPLEDVAEVDENGDPLLDEDGQQVITPGLKTKAIELAKAQCRDMLSDTDWLVVRAAEDGLRNRPQPRNMPDAVADRREAIRAACGDIEVAITGAIDLDAFIALYDAPVDAQGNPTGPAPISDWPE